MCVCVCVCVLCVCVCCVCVCVCVCVFSLFLTQPMKQPLFPLFPHTHTHTHTHTHIHRLIQQQIRFDPNHLTKVWETSVNRCCFTLTILCGCCCCCHNKGNNWCFMKCANEKKKAKTNKKHKAQLCCHAFRCLWDNFVRAWLILDATELYILLLVWVTLALIQGLWGVWKHKLAHQLSCKIFNGFWMEFGLLLMSFWSDEPHTYFIWSENSAYNIKKKKKLW